MQDKVKWIILLITNTIVGYSLGNYIIYATLIKIHELFNESMTYQQKRFIFDLIEKRYFYAIFFALVMWMFTVCLWFVIQNLKKNNIVHPRL